MRVKVRCTPIPALPGLSQGNAIFKMCMDRLF